MGKISAIDPAALNGAIQKMDTGANTLAGACRSLTAEFGRYGLDTSGLRKLDAIAAWTRDQLPDLRRRHALAVAANRAHPNDTLAHIAEPFSLGAADHALYEQAVAAGDRASVALVTSDLRAHLDDPEFLQAYADAAPDDVTAFQGLPADVADRLNRLRLKADVEKPGCPQELKDLWAHLTDPADRTHRSDMFLLGYDALGNGHVAVSYGNPDTAANTAVYVPGTGSALAKASGDLNRALTLYASANDTGAAGTTASIYWLGYDAPGWSFPGPASQSFADAGAPKLAAFVNSLAPQHTGADHVTVIGHSYGTTVVGDAFAHAGMKADDAVFVGSPGVTVDRASQLGLDPGHVWASKAKFDPVPEVSATLDPLKWLDDHSDRFGNDPTSSSFGGRTFDSGEGSGVTHAHSEYWDPGPSLTNMTDIVIGRPDRVTAMPQEDRTGVLPNLADQVDPVLGIPNLLGPALQNLGHRVGGYWGAPIEDSGDALHSFGQAENDVAGTVTDLLTGDLDSAGHEIEDIGSDLADSGENAVRAVTDFFT
ncbi:Alpha/beta hydrolase [Actinacidiphila yanglinensis]|uniref:Alpha/beta hydrolase n=1 Tax=Actinacidiphila yanglinensis TaxID=310779 RepID=A0A1H6A0P0_9ACTN|nr:alpha/beta hydrolase [Actinacidiphila yanglinensis]SEG42011.1 Alpha/beta hydrolase [Actinacidiphila yanglinensis]